VPERTINLLHSKEKSSGREDDQNPIRTFSNFLYKRVVLSAASRG